MKYLILPCLFLLIFPSIVFSQWEEQTLGSTANLSAVVFQDDDIGFIVGINEIYSTIDGGETWNISHTAGDMVFLEDVFIIEENSVIAVGKDYNTDNNISVILKSIDGGVTWDNIPTPTTALLKSVFFVSSNIGYCSGDAGTILKTIDGGNSWEELNSATNKNLQSIHFVDDLTGIGVGGNTFSSAIVKTQDGGLTWQSVNIPSSNNLQSVYFTNSQTAYVVGWNGELIKTEDCGTTWINQTSVNMAGNLEIVFTDEETGYIVGGQEALASIQKTTNAGDLWEDISPAINHGLTSIHFPSPSTGYAVGANGTVLKTTSGGISNILPIPTSAIECFPNPVANWMAVQSKDNEVITSLEVYNGNGLLIYNSNPNSTTLSIDFSDFPADNYYLVVKGENERFVKKLVKI